MKTAFITIRLMKGKNSEYIFHYESFHEFLIRTEVILLDVSRNDPTNPIKNFEVNIQYEN